MPEPKKFESYSTAYGIPLDADHLATIGKIVATFGHIEGSIDSIIQKLSGIGNYYVLDIMYDGKQFGSKVTLLEKLAKQCAPEDHKIRIISACRALKEVSADRNHVIHGQWGVLYDRIVSNTAGTEIDVTGEPMIAAKSDKRPNRAFLATELPNLLTRTEAAALTLIDAAWRLNRNDGVAPQGSLLFVNRDQPQKSSRPKSP